MKTTLRERLTMYQCVIRPKVHFAPEFSFNNCVVIVYNNIILYLIHNILLYHI